MRVIKWIFRAIAKTINFTRLLVLNLIFLGVIAVVVLSFNSEETINVPQGAALNLDLSGQIVEERRPADPFQEISNEVFGKDPNEFREIALSDVIHAIRFAQSDNRITALVLSLENLQGTGMNKLFEIGDALEKFKTSGKKIYAYGDFYSQSQYYLASYADNLMLNPQGAIALQGLGVYRLYFKSAIEKLDITPHVFKVGTYKSFVEPYTRDSMSALSKEANLHWLNQLWDAYVSQVAERRKVSHDAISPNIDSYLERLKAVQGDQAAYAKASGLVDELKSSQEARQFLIANVGENSNGSDYLQISLDSYLGAIPPLFNYQEQGQDKIAAIFASGQIMNGEQPVGVIGGDTLSHLLNEALMDSQVKAVVLRLDSPGGSAFASEQVRQQVLALKAANKPVVVSMSSTSASGGYWIASAANEIVASPVTLTGSIGIFGMFATVENALAKMGITNDGVGTNALSSVDITRPLPSYMKQIVQLSIENGYQQFINVVAQGRNMTPAQVDSLAQGRVWTGQDALEKGLVDHLGGFDVAMSRAANLAELDAFEVKVIRPELSVREQFMADLMAKSAQFAQQSLVSSPTLRQILKAVDEQAAPLASFNDPKGVYALCPACEQIKL
ncbi:signal peptide peptidase SppA [Motilimonas cestriensis]|uniref:Signal peptide peptidase SppA n=1 Tax=Motilimonas cestriensis TaxID=2742685 RepID=A0ABS8WEL6_9GAMM|nr:signal peptide peptidase SppA [Motilimonas cestriensis]